MFSIQKQNNDAFREKLTYNQSCFEADIAKIKTNLEETSADDALESLMNLEMTVFQINSLVARRRTSKDQNFMMYYSKLGKIYENHCKELLNEKGISDHFKSQEVKDICEELIAKPCRFQITYMIAELKEKNLKIQAFIKSHKNISLNQLSEDFISLQNRCEEVLNHKEETSFEAYFKYEEVKKICEDLTVFPDRSQTIYMIVELEKVHRQILYLKQSYKESNIPLEQLSEKFTLLKNRCKKMAADHCELSKTYLKKNWNGVAHSKKEGLSPVVARRAEKR